MEEARERVIPEVAAVGCPFYIYDDSKARICCEGIVEGCELILRFRRKEGMEQQKKIFCCEHYKKCEVFRMLMAKYED